MVLVRHRRTVAMTIAVRQAVVLATKARIIGVRSTMDLASIVPITVVPAVRSIAAQRPSLVVAWVRDLAPVVLVRLDSAHQRAMFVAARMVPHLAARRGSVRHRLVKTNVAVPKHAKGAMITAAQKVAGQKVVELKPVRPRAVPVVRRGDLKGVAKAQGAAKVTVARLLHGEMKT